MNWRSSRAPRTRLFCAHGRQWRAVREGESPAGFQFAGLRTRTVPSPRFAAWKRKKRSRFELEVIMSDSSLSTPPTPASADFEECVETLHSVAAVINDCRWVADALHLSASSTSVNAPHDANKRMEGVSRMLFTILHKANNDILNIVEVLESGKDDAG
jgi:hypothetical protein